MLRKNLFTSNLPYLVILVLIVIILLQRCGGEPEKTPEPKIITKTVIDTQWYPKTDTVYATPKQVGESKIDTTWKDSIRLKDSSYEYLFGRYVELGNKYYSRTVFEQKFKIDTIGEAVLRDTVVSNRIVGRSFSYSIDYPVVTKTTTTTVYEPYKPKRQLYAGGTIWATNKTLVGGSVGLLYKDKKDRVFGANVGVFNSQLTYGVTSYWKIKL